MSKLIDVLKNNWYGGRRWLNNRSRQDVWPSLATIAVVMVAAFQLHHQGRLWWCACGEYFLWAGDTWSRHNSQHLFDPYSLTHILHGMAYYGILALIASRLPRAWRFWLAITIESLWEVIENSSYVIDRYRAVTISLDYMGNSVANSIGDIICCVLGFFLAYQLGFRKSLVFFIIAELILNFWIRDSLILNIIMLIYPIEAIKMWQIGGH